MKQQSRGKPSKRSSFSKEKGKVFKGKDQKKGMQRGMDKGKGFKRDDRKDDRKGAPKRKPKTPYDPNRLTHKEEHKQNKEQRQESDRVHKLVVAEELKKSSPDLQKTRSHISQIKSRGLRQRLRIKLEKLSK